MITVFKKIKKLILIILLTTFIIPQTLFAYSNYIVAGGENIGLQINNNGVIIAGFYKIDDSYPGHEAKLKIGDTIVKSNNTEIKTINDFIESIKNNGDNKNLKLSFKRNNKIMNTNLTVMEKDGVIKTGLYVKDMISGIGTLTFIDPESNIYGALGHEVVETNSGVLLDVKDGKIYNSNVTSIDKSTRGDPGSKDAIVDSNNVYGNINENTKFGIFGNYTKEINKDKLYKVGTYEDIKIGEAKIITVLDKDIKKEYSINILKVNNDTNSNKNILFEITDTELINKSGGIVQGMSGSPIVQGSNIIGAVTNVVVNNPKKGYGILITTMLKEGEN